MDPLPPPTSQRFGAAQAKRVSKEKGTSMGGVARGCVSCVRPRACAREMRIEFICRPVRKLDDRRVSSN